MSTILCSDNASVFGEITLFFRLFCLLVYPETSVQLAYGFFLMLCLLMFYGIYCLQQKSVVDDDPILLVLTIVNISVWRVCYCYGQ